MDKRKAAGQITTQVLEGGAKVVCHNCLPEKILMDVITERLRVNVKTSQADSRPLSASQKQDLTWRTTNELT